MSRVYLGVAVALVAVGIGAASQAPIGGTGSPVLFGFPSSEPYWFSANMTGVATNSATGEAFHLILKVKGAVDRSLDTTTGQGLSEEGNLQAAVFLVDAATEDTFETFHTTLHYRADRLDGPAAGLPGWKFTFTSPGAAGDLVKLALDGQTVGAQAITPGTTYVVASQGIATVLVQEGHQATDFSLDAHGLSQEERLA